MLSLHYAIDDFSDDDLAEAESECMTRPSPASFWDDRLYTTHGPTMSWAERGDDLVAESNYLMAVEFFEGLAAWDDVNVTDEDFIDATIGDWLVGSLRQLFVRVRDDNGAFTDAFRYAVAIGHTLRDYPILDESDFSEREWKSAEADLAEGMSSAQRDYLDDSTHDESAIESVFYAAMSDGALDYNGSEGYDWDDVAKLYAASRDEYFNARANEALNAPLSGQSAIHI